MRGLFLHGVYAWPRVNARSFLDTRVYTIRVIKILGEFRDPAKINLAD